MGESAQPSAGRVFISYRRDDTAYPAGWLYDELVQHLGGNVFKDIDSIELGADWVDAITAAVASCDVLLALIGDEWLTVTDEEGRRRIDDPADYVRLEIESALERDVLVIPVLVDGARMPHSADLPHSLAKLVRRQALELSPARFEFDTSRLLEVLDPILQERRGEQAAQSPASTAAGRATTAESHAWLRRDTALRSDQRPPGIEAEGDASGPSAPTRPSRQDSSEESGMRRRHFSTRQMILAGLGACVVSVALMVVVVVASSPEAPPGTDSDGQSPEAAPTAEVQDTGSASESRATAEVLVASFEAGTEGWGPQQSKFGSVGVVSDFHTHGSHSLRVDSNGIRGQGWYGANLDPPLDITGKHAVSVDIKTTESGTDAAVAVQYGDSTFCQSPQLWGSIPARTDRHTITLELDPETMDCDPSPPRSGRNTLTAVWVWFGGLGSFRLDNVRIE